MLSIEFFVGARARVRACVCVLFIGQISVVYN